MWPGPVIDQNMYVTTDPESNTESDPASDAGPDRLVLFQAHRSRMFAIAYRMLGSATDAEDVLQDAWLRWQNVDHTQVSEPAAFLARVVTNLCLNQLDSARVRREVYSGPWLPEPVLTSAVIGTDGPGLGPLDDAVQRESVSFALLTVMERLTPAERAAYVLREAFGYSHREVAELIGTTEANARQLHSRARRHLAAEPRQTVEPGPWQTLVGRFMAAARDGDVAGLESLLAEGVISRSDGGGVVHAARVPVIGRRRVATFISRTVQRNLKDSVSHLVEVNGELALVITAGQQLQTICFVSVEDGQISGLDFVLAPDKLAFAAAQLSRIGGPSGLSGESAGDRPA